MRSFFIFSFFSSVLLFFSCQQKEKKQDTFFELEVFIQNQIQQLKQHKAFIIKKTILNNQIQVDTIKNPNWEKEIQTLKSIDIPTSLKKDYKINRFSDDSIFFQSVKNQDKGINYVKVTMNESERKIEGELIDINPMYKYKKEIVFVIQKIKEKEFLKNYKIIISQKVTFVGNVNLTQYSEIIYR